MNRFCNREQVADISNRPDNLGAYKEAESFVHSLYSGHVCDIDWLSPYS